MLTDLSLRHLSSHLQHPFSQNCCLKHQRLLLQTLVLGACCVRPSSGSSTVPHMCCLLRLTVPRLTSDTVLHLQMNRTTTLGVASCNCGGNAHTLGTAHFLLRI